MISRSLLLALALVALSHVRVASARLGQHPAHGPAVPAARPPQIRTRHARRRLTELTEKVADGFDVVEALNLSFREIKNHIEIATAGKSGEDPKRH